MTIDYSSVGTKATKNDNCLYYQCYIDPGSMYNFCNSVRIFLPVYMNANGINEKKNKNDVFASNAHRNAKQMSNSGVKIPKSK